MTRRALIASLCIAASGDLTVDLLPQSLATPLGINAAWFDAQRKRQQFRIAYGSAEHIAYYLLQSKTFSSEPAIDPTQAAHQKLPCPIRRSSDFLAAIPKVPRHALIRNLYDNLNWPLERCYAHTLRFLEAKELNHAPLEPLYQARGLSSDTSPESLTALSTLNIEAGRVLLAGPGLDLTRRENFSDDIPLKSHQLDHLRSLYKQVDAIDIRPEVIAHLHATPHDLTTQILPTKYDLIVATNLFVYLNEAELLCALTGLARSLNPSGKLVHNDTRFAAKVFGEALDIPVEKYQPVSLGGRKWDRLVIHQKLS